mgnify:CR=1 FL=1
MAGHPIPSKANAVYSNLWPTFAEFYDIYTALDGLAIPRLSLKDDRVDVRHFLSLLNPTLSLCLSPKLWITEWNEPTRLKDKPL